VHTLEPWTVREARRYAGNHGSTAVLAELQHDGGLVTSSARRPRTDQAREGAQPDFARA
jgi:hypothetical protein